MVRQQAEQPGEVRTRQAEGRLLRHDLELERQRRPDRDEAQATSSLRDPIKQIAEVALVEQQAEQLGEVHAR